MRDVRRKLRVFHLCADDLDIWGDLFVVTTDRERAVKLLTEYYEERIRELVTDITDDLDDEEYESYLEEGTDVVIEEH